MNSDNSLTKPISISESNILGEFEAYLRRVRKIPDSYDLISMTIGGLTINGKDDHVLSGEIKLKREEVEVVRLRNGTER